MPPHEHTGRSLSTVTAIRSHDGHSPNTNNLHRQQADQQRAHARSIRFQAGAADQRVGPSNDLALAFEATQHLDPHEQQLVKELIEAVLLKHDAKRWTTTATG